MAEQCPGCGKQMNMIGLAGAVVLPDGTGPVGYMLCPRCAKTMRKAGSDQRDEILTRVELVLMKTQGGEQ